MSNRQEDELDLIAMGIAEAVKRSDNLRVPRDPEWAKSCVDAHVGTGEQDVEVSGYHAVNVRGIPGRHIPHTSNRLKSFRNNKVIEFIEAGNSIQEAARFFSLTPGAVAQIYNRGY